MSTTYQQPVYIPVAQTAKLVRKALAAAFPGIKFNVRSKSYSGGASINVHWTDGPTEKQVKEVTQQFEGSEFDGMIDLKSSVYTEHEGQRVRFMADFIFGNRHYSRAFTERIIADVLRDYDNIGAPEIIDFDGGTTLKYDAAAAHYPGNGNGYASISDLIYRRCHETPA